MALKVLSALDSARIQYYHFKAILIAGMGLFTDAYDFFCIPPILRLISYIYYGNDPDNIPLGISSAIIALPFLGSAIGSLVAGYLGDKYGRKRVYGLALVLMMMSSFGCGFSICTSPTCVLASLGFFRFCLGLGIGGDYPLSATIMSEYANRRTRGAFIAAVFSMQGLGILASSLVTMAVCKVFYSTPQLEADLAWRIILMVGAIPAALTFYWRMLMPETARYTALVEQNIQQATMNMQQVLDVNLSELAEDPGSTPNSSPSSSYPLLSREFLLRHGRDLFSCAASWLLLDIVFYSNNLFQSRFLHTAKDHNPFQDAYEVARFQALFAVCSTIPGYWATVVFIDRIGRVEIQIMGFFFMAIGLFAAGIPYDSYWQNHSHNHPVGFQFLYGLTFFFSNFGPNTTTFIVPAELFPARFRTTCHGISGAFGKMGAIIGLVGIHWATRENQDGKPKAATALIILGGVCVLGMLVTYLFTRETMGRSLEENENENQDETQGLCFLRGFAGSCLERQLPSSVVELGPLFRHEPHAGHTVQNPAMSNMQSVR